LNLAKCFVDDCGEEFGNLDPDCENCFHLDDIDNIESAFERCTDAQLSGNCTFLFDGWSDNLLLSKTPLANVDFLLYHDSPLAQWTVLYAQTNSSTFNVPVNVFCTHLSAQIPIVDTTEANSAQITELLSYIRQKVPNTTAPVFVLGDYNAGPRIDGLDATRPENFMQFINGGYHSSLLGANKTLCTYCGSENPLAADTTSEDWMIDHIFVSEKEAVCLGNATRIADDNTFVKLSNGDTSPLSDHYGVKASFCQGTFNLVQPQFLPPDDGINDVQGSDGVALYSIHLSYLLWAWLFATLLT
jgi:endonuclease/exonuclease/phosphatase family metal-dependent hydrolase